MERQPTLGWIWGREMGLAALLTPGGETVGEKEGSSSYYSRIESREQSLPVCENSATCSNFHTVFFLPQRNLLPHFRIIDHHHQFSHVITCNKLHIFPSVHWSPQGHKLSLSSSSASCKNRDSILLRSVDHSPRCTREGNKYSDRFFSSLLFWCSKKLPKSATASSMAVIKLPPLFL